MDSKERNNPESTSKINVSPLPDSPFGANISGLDVKNINSEDKKLIWQAYRKYHGLICFEFEHLIEANELHGLTAVFGENEFSPGKINGIGKSTPPGEETLSVEEQVERLQAKGVDPYLAFIGNVDPTTKKIKPVDQSSLVNGNGTQICPT